MELRRFFLIAIWLFSCLPIASCGTKATSSPIATPVPTSVPTIAPKPTPAYPPIEGPEPSTQVGIFYYPWYSNPATDGEWVHWSHTNFTPPLDITSDFYPVLGPYSSQDPMTLAQQFAWLRQAGVGLIISSWWGPNHYTDKAVPLLLDQAQRYGLKVTFLIEGYPDRTADKLVRDVRYLYNHYGDHPAFYYTTDTSRWVQDDSLKGLFFAFAPWFATEVETEEEVHDWQDALDTVHAFPESGIFIAMNFDCTWIDRTHFDGLFNYIHVHLDGENPFNWSRCLPSDAWYVPSVAPGNSPTRIGYPADLYEPRLDGETYNNQWKAALGTGIQPHMVTITSFNEWHEGSQIEPAAYGMSDGEGYSYADYGTVGEEGYLDLTRRWIDEYLRMDWPAVPEMRVRITTTSGWTSFILNSGGNFARGTVGNLTEEATLAIIGDRVDLNQDLDRAVAGGSVEALIDFSILNVETTSTLEFEIQRGNVGWTKVEIYNNSGQEPFLIDSVTWSSIVGGLNSYHFSIPVVELTGTHFP